jgi:hypothetical protein
MRVVLNYSFSFPANSTYFVEIFDVPIKAVNRVLTELGDQRSLNVGHFPLSVNEVNDLQTNVDIEPIALMADGFRPIYATMREMAKGRPDIGCDGMRTLAASFLPFPTSG